jgi:branched-subunit amino acid transport protein
MTTWETIVTILGLTVITVLTRSFFLIPERELPLPGWLKQGLRYAPLAALVAVVAPEVLMSQGHFISTLKDARLPAVLASTLYFFWRGGILGTIVVGTAVMLALRLTIGW